jgi:membrane-associated HD superfamily phosphohydrolase
MEIIRPFIQDNLLLKIGNYSAVLVVVIFLILFLLARKQKDNKLTNSLLILFIVLLLISVISFMIHFAFISLDPIV